VSGQRSGLGLCWRWSGRSRHLVVRRRQRRPKPKRQMQPAKQNIDIIEDSLRSVSAIEIDRKS